MRKLLTFIWASVSLITLKVLIIDGFNPLVFAIFILSLLNTLLQIYKEEILTIIEKKNK